MTHNHFNEITWRGVCEQCAQHAARRSGLSETIFNRELAAALGPQLQQISEPHREHATKIAREYGHLTEKELKEDDQWNADHGYCDHGIELGCCPRGCE